MMVNKLIIISVTCLSLGFNLHSQDEKRNPDILILLYEEMISSRDTNVAKSFFYYFPDSHSSFDYIYGIRSPLYEEALDHVVALKSLDTLIDLKIYVRKLIRLSIGGEWDADGVSYLQGLVHNKFKAHSGIFKEWLLTMPPPDVLSFFYFYLDDVHLPSDKKLPDELGKMGKSNSFLSVKIGEALEAVYSNHLPH